MSVRSALLRARVIRETFRIGGAERAQHALGLVADANSPPRLASTSTSTSTSYMLPYPCPVCRHAPIRHYLHSAHGPSHHITSRHTASDGIAMAPWSLCPPASARRLRREMYTSPAGGGKKKGRHAPAVLDLVSRCTCTCTHCCLETKQLGRMTAQSGGWGGRGRATGDEEALLRGRSPTSPMSPMSPSPCPPPSPGTWTLGLSARPALVEAQTPARGVGDPSCSTQRRTCMMTVVVSTVVQWPPLCSADRLC